MLTLTVGRRIFAAFLLNLGFFCGLDFCQANPKHQAAQFAAGISNQFQNASSVANFLAWAGFESQVAQLKSQMTSSELKAPWPLINAEGSRLLTEDGRLLIEILSFDKESVNLQVGGRPLRIHFQKDPQPQLAPLLKISARQQSPWISTALAAEDKLQETPLFRLGYLFNAINSVVALGYILTTPSAPGSMLGGFGRFLAGSSVLGFGLLSAGRAFADENVVSFSSCQGSQLLSAETSSGKRLLVQIEDGSNKNPKKIRGS